MASRINDVYKWCNKKNDCGDPTRLCDELEDGYDTSKHFQDQYPKHFM